MSNKKLDEINQIINEREAIFQKFALSSGISELAYRILYIIRLDSDKEWIQSDLSDSYFFSRKSVNSAISKLIDLNFVYLDSKKYSGNKKVIRITKDGEKFVRIYIDPIIEADSSSFLDMKEEDQNKMVELEKIQLELFKEKIKKLKIISFGGKNE